MLATATLVACANHEPDAATIARRWIDALNTHDVDAVSALMAIDGTYSDPLDPFPLSDGALRSLLVRTWKDWADRVYTLRKVIAEDHDVVVTWSMRQTNASGAVVPLEGVFVLRVSDGRIDEVRAYFDASPYVRLLADAPPRRGRRR